MKVNFFQSWLALIALAVSTVFSSAAPSVREGNKDANVPPTVKLLMPTNGSSFFSRPNIELSANAFAATGWVTSVEFLANDTSVGVVSNRFESGRPIWWERRANHFQFVWLKVAPGNYSLTALATDNAGLQTTSAPVNVIVTTNLPEPKVRIVSPFSGAEFPSLAPINIYAAAGEAGGVVDFVEFFANGKSLGTATNYLAAEPSSSFHLRMQVLPYYFRWTNAPVGSNVVTAVATDNNGTQAMSSPVNINVSTNAYHPRHRW